MSKPKQQLVAHRSSLKKYRRFGTPVSVPFRPLCREKLRLQPACTALRRASSQHKMQDQGNHSEDKQQVDQSSRHMKHCEAANPCNQQNDEQYCPDAHFSSPRLEVPTPSRNVLLRVTSKLFDPWHKIVSSQPYWQRLLQSLTRIW